jgi:hypothetical protein
MTIAPALAVTNGRLDGEGHPAVVLLLMDVDGLPAFRCSGTLLSPTVLLTAGHCTDNFPGHPYTGMRVFTESDVQAGIGITNNYPYAGPNTVEAVCGTLILYMKRAPSSFTMSVLSSSRRRVSSYRRDSMACSQPQISSTH